MIESRTDRLSISAHLSQKSRSGVVGTARIVLYSRTWRSGTGLYVQGLAEGLAQAGAELTFIAPRGDAELELEQIKRICPLREFTEDAGKPRAARALRSLLRVIAGLGALLGQRFRTRDIIVSVPEPLVFWLPALVLLRLSGGRVVVVCHDPQPHSWRLPSTLRWLERGAIAASYRLAWRIVVLAKAGAMALQHEYAVPAEKIAIIPHGAFPAQPLGPLPGKRSLLVFGTIRRNKQVHLAMDAVAALKAEGIAVHLTVAGAGDPNDLHYLELCLARAALPTAATTMEIGYISEARVVELFAAADAVLLPYTDFDSQSGVAVLAGIAGRPVISTDAGGIPDLVEAGLTAEPIAAPNGAAEISVAVRRFLDTAPQEWSTRVERGRIRLRQALAWQNIGVRFMELFA